MVDLKKEPTGRVYGRFGFSLLRKFVIFFSQKKFDNNDDYKNYHEDMQ